MDFRTTIPIPKGVFPLSHTDKTLLLGSCFVENIGKRLEENKFPVDLNPFGVIYNPASIAKSLYRLITPVPFIEEDLFETGNIYHSFLHHSRFSGSDSKEMIDRINERLVYSSAFLKEADCLIITFGTAWVYQLKSTGEVVSNCHKLPDSLFVRIFLPVEEICKEWETLLGKLWELNPRLRILFTISPVRHWKDGPHGNQLSKSTLLLAVDQLCHRYSERISYFPSYEIQLDELRDYRFYADDMLHPSELAIRYIWEKLEEFCFTQETRTVLKEWQTILKAIEHKPFNPDSETFRSFIMQTLLKVEQLERKYPYFYMAKEKELLLSKLK